MRLLLITKVPNNINKLAQPNNIPNLPINNKQLNNTPSLNNISLEDSEYPYIEDPPT